MAGTESPWLIPSLDGLRRHWIAHAEISASPSDPKSVGLSVYHFDPFEFREFASTWLTPAQRELDAKMRSRFELDPRRWTKVSFPQRAISQYFVVDPSNTFPISTLRVGLKLIDPDVDISWLEGSFRPALEQSGALWALIAKWKEGKAIPRISCMIEPETLNSLLHSLDLENAAHWVELSRSLLPVKRIFVSMDISSREVALDFEDVDVARIPPECLSLWSHPPSSTGPKYLKVRNIRDAKNWTVYRPLVDVLSQSALTRLVGGRRDAKSYYDENNAAITGAFGSTFQAGLIGRTSDSQATLRNLVKACGLLRGERVADMGCGSGGPAIAMASSVEGVHVTGVTISREQAQSAAGFIREAGLESRVDVVLGDYGRAPLKSEVFDRVVFFESLGYAEDLARVLSEARRILKPGGCIYIKDVIRKPDPLTAQERLELAEFDDLYAQRTPTHEEIVKGLVCAGFANLRVEPLSKVMQVAGFYAAMLDQKAADGLTEFGRRHYRSFRCLPVTFAHYSGDRAK